MSSLNPIEPVENAIKGILMATAMSAIMGGRGVSSAKYNGLVRQYNELVEMAQMLAYELGYKRGESKSTITYIEFQDQVKELQSRTIKLREDQIVTLMTMTHALNVKVSEFTAAIDKINREKDELEATNHALVENIHKAQELVHQTEDLVLQERATVAELKQKLEAEHERAEELERHLEIVTEENERMKRGLAMPFPSALMPETRETSNVVNFQAPGRLS